MVLKSRRACNSWPIHSISSHLEFVKSFPAITYNLNDFTWIFFAIASINRYNINSRKLNICIMKYACNYCYCTAIYTEKNDEKTF